jgi:electron transfer flavoprotein alpha subunit
MGNILVVAEHLEGKLKKVSLPIVTFAKEVAKHQGGDVIGLVLGSGVSEVAEQFATSGVDKVVVVDDPSFENFLAESYAAAVAAAAKDLDCDLICAPASIRGKDFLPRTAAELEAGMISEAVEVWSEDGELRFKRPMWAGNILAIMAIDSPVKVLTVRPTAFDPLPPGDAAPIEARGDSKPAHGTTFHAFNQVKSERPDLTDADVVVAGGRGLKSAEGFHMLEDLADLLGGALGASRAAVDSDMAPFDWQIGQTGKVVAPDLYFAIAISGAIQHLAGMKGSKVIVAINKDPEAPIFQVSDYGLVADAFKVVPELNKQVAAIKAEG